VDPDDKSLPLASVYAPRQLSRAMQQLQSSYSTYFRVRHGLHGHVFGGRYKAPLVDGDRYLLALTRYIHLNPVRVPSVKSRPITEQMWYLRRHPWSSYRDYIGRRHRYAWVSHGPLLDLVSGGRAGKPAAYRKFVEAGIGAPDEELNAAMRLSSKAVGSTEFCAWAEREYQKIKNGQPRPEDVAMRRQEVVVPPEAVQRAVAKRCRIKTQELLLSRGNTFARDVLMTAWRDLSDLSNREIGHRLGHADGATVGKRFSDLKRDSQQKCRAQAVVKRMGKRLIANCKA